MKFSEKWLREWVDPAVSTEVLAEQLTMAGLEVDAIDAVAGAFSSVVVGEILEAAPHPDADRLRVCQVAVGADEPLTIVCGASNARPGLKAPTALVGATLPGDFKIKKSKLRGVASFGMLCSAKELGLAEAAEGLMELPADAPVGSDLRDYLELDDVSIELGLTPNRSDCLGLVGVAREAAVLNRLPLNGLEIEPVAAAIDDTFPVAVSAPADCPRYLGRVIRGLNPAAASPLWMQERLRRSGLRSLGPLVDVTNYVLLELGQPLHAFDFDRLQGGIDVRRARSGEKLRLLNDQEVELNTDTLVICDGAGPQAIAGVMGGEATAVTDATCNVFLESAFFAPDAVVGRARAYGLHTDASHRFERGVSPDLQASALERATALLLEIAGGEAGPLVDVTSEQDLPVREPVRLRHARATRVLGMVVPPAEVEEILERLGMLLSREEEGWLVTPPPFRFDIAIEEDLIEEVGRIYGYNNLPTTAATTQLAMAPATESCLPAAALRRTLVERGYQEAITYSFVDPKFQKLLDPERTPVALANPISAEMAVMRTNLWPGLLQALSYNLNRQQERVRLFEIGRRFLGIGAESGQEPMLAGVAYGPLLPEQWGEAARVVDFYDVKADVEALFGPAGVRCEPAAHPALHPGQSARLICDGRPVGWLGALHPEVAQACEVGRRAYLFEVELAAIVRRPVPSFRELSKFPQIRRDIAVVVDAAVPAAALEAAVRRVAPAAMRELKLFDVYAGEGVDSGRKSVAIGLTLQEDSRTLTDSEVEAVIAKVMAALTEEFGATLRD